ncbi:MAG: alpha/beta hydrolase [Burkholderiaceae bacterium]
MTESFNLPDNLQLEPITGHYAHIEVNGCKHRIYFEQAGQGIDLLCLHTAGSDGRQFRALLNDPEILSRYRVVVYDMPWHGKSSPPAGWQNEEYQLTSDDYVEQIMAVKRALGLSKPVVMGCSIGGRIVLHLVEQFASEFRAAIGLQSSTHVDPYYDVNWLHRPDVHGGEVCGAVAYGLTAPTSPDDDRWETVWHYMQGGPGIFKGDLYFYKIDGDIRDKLNGIDTSVCPLYFLTGDYDFSCAPADTLALVQALGSANATTINATIMKDMGHFPMSENPASFIQYLKPILNDIASPRFGAPASVTT